MNHDWHDLIERYIAGTLPDDEALALQNALKSDTDLRALYLDYMNLDVALGSHAESRAAVNEILASPMAGETSRPARWLSWRPLAAAAAGIVFGMFCTSMVFGFVSRQQVRVQTLLMEGFEDAEMIPGRGVPSSVGVWSGDLLPPSEATDEVVPAEGKRMVVLPTVENKRLGFAYRFVDLTSLPPLEPGQNRQIEVTAQFHGKAPGDRSSLRMRLAVFTEDVVGASEIWKDSLVDEMALLNVVKPVKAKSAAWTKVRSTIDVPAEARVLMVSLGAGDPRASPIKADHYLDDVQIRLITREAPLP